MTTYAELLDAHLSEPTPETLDALREAIRRAPGFDPDLAVRRRATALAREGRDAEVVEVIEAAMPGATFSPSVHALLAQALRRTGRVVEATRHATLARAALDSILSSGDGTLEQPWTVIRVSDEHDLVDSLGTRPVSQLLVQRAGRSIDVLECADGRVVHFAVPVASGLPVRG